MPPPMTDILIKYRWNNYFEPYHYFDDLHCEYEMLNEVTHWLEEIPDNTAQLQADKAELLEALKKIYRIGHKPYRNTRNEEIEINRIAESLIQKHKKCQENTPR